MSNSSKSLENKLLHFHRKIVRSRELYSERFSEQIIIDSSNITVPAIWYCKCSGQQGHLMPKALLGYYYGKKSFYVSNSTYYLIKKELPWICCVGRLRTWDRWSRIYLIAMENGLQSSKTIWFHCKKLTNQCTGHKKWQQELHRYSFSVKLMLPVLDGSKFIWNQTLSIIVVVSK